MVCLITKPTRIQRLGNCKTESLIDVILTNQPKLFIDSGVYEPGLSNHALVYGFLSEKICRSKGKVVKFRSMKHFEEEAFENDLGEAPWHVGEIFDDVDERAYFINTLLTQIIDELMPKKEMRVREKDVPYMTPEWKVAIRARRRAARRFEKTKAPEDWELKRKFRNEATRLRRKAIREYWKRKSEDLKKRPREFYRTFMPFLGSKKVCKQSTADLKLRVNGKVNKNMQETAEVMADYFMNITDGLDIVDMRNGTSVADFDNHCGIHAITRMFSSGRNSFKIKEMGVAEVQNALKQINPGKSTGWDGIPPKALKCGADQLALPLTTLFNSCIRERKWPSDWKKGEWVPIHKKDDPLDKENYRPVTIQIALNKVFEKLLFQQVVDGTSDYLSEYLTAYRKLHGCATALMMLIENWRMALDNGELVGLLSTDMSKAFDCLHHPLLLAKLRAYGLDESGVKLLQSYFEDRYSRVRIGDVVSSWKPVEKGCPQGSSFGPLLWNLFQNDLTSFVDNKLCMYADDHQFYESGKDFSLVEAKLQGTAKAVTEWYDQNGLKGNYTKYASMIISRSGKGDMSINVKDFTIEPEHSISLLGVHIDSKLSFSEHISNVCKKSSH